jgi:hypothetical protein
MKPKGHGLEDYPWSCRRYGINVDADGKSTNCGRGALIETEDNEQAAYDLRWTPHPRR